MTLMKQELSGKNLIIQMEQAPINQAAVQFAVNDIIRLFSPNSVQIVFEDSGFLCELYPTNRWCNQEPSIPLHSIYLEEIIDTIKIYELAIDGLRTQRVGQNILVDFTAVPKEFAKFEMPELFANIQKLVTSLPVSTVCVKNYILIRSPIVHSCILPEGRYNVSQISERCLNQLIHPNFTAKNESALFGPLKYFLDDSSDSTAKSNIGLESLRF